MRSRSNSTDVPWFSAVVTPTDSECSDWASHSLAMGVVVVGVGAATVELKEATAVFNGVGPDELPDTGFLKDERRFCAEDLRRIVGRCGKSEENGAN